MPIGASTFCRMCSAKGRPATLASARPATDTAALEYLVRVSGWYTSRVRLRLVNSSSSDGSVGSK